MEKNKNNDLNEERNIKKRIIELNRLIESEQDGAKLRLYKHELLRYQVKQSNIKFFKDFVSCDYSGLAKIHYYKKTLKTVNEIMFAGFDYYFTDDIGQELEDGTIDTYKSSVDMLINKEHLHKLKDTVESYDNLYFISYKDEEDQDRYAIWYKLSPVFINLVPFTRNKNNSVTIDGDIEYLDSEIKEYQEAPYRIVKK